MPSHWQLSQWQEAENEWERLLVFGSPCRSADSSPGPSKVPGCPTTRADTPRCSETMPRPSTPTPTPTPKPQEPPTDTGTNYMGDRVASSPENTEEHGENPWTTDDKEMGADGDTGAPTPWPESWYEGGSELGLQQFAAKVMADCQGYYGDAEDTNVECGTAQCPTDDDTGHPRRDDRGGATTTGVSSTNSLAPYAEGQSFGGHPTKRQRNSDDEGNEKDRPPKRQDARGPPDDNDTNPRKSYACPYQKRNPRQSPFCGMPHGSKRGFGWSTVSRVK